MVEASNRLHQTPAPSQAQAQAVGTYRERMAAERVAASAQRKLEREAWHRRIELHVEVRRIAMAAVKATIRDRGDKLSLYSLAQLRRRPMR